MAKILVVDNYDSFVYTIVGYLEVLGADVDVVRNDAARLDAPDLLDAYDGVLISPGPGTPKAAGSSEDVIRLCAQSGTPMLGVCLGHQALGEIYGATVVHAAELMHGKTSQVEHSGTGLFDGVPSPFTATRYHSLAVADNTVPDTLQVIARTSAGTVMGLRHRELPLYGVQFHPESVMTEHGHRILANWLAVCGQDDAVAASAGLAPLVAATAPAPAA